MAIMLLFSSLLNPWITAFLELPKKIENFDTVIALCVVIFICVSGVASWKEIQERVEWGVLVFIRWWFNTQYRDERFWCQ